MPSGPLAGSTLAQVAVPVRDAERAARFYRDTLGLPFLFAAPPLAFLACGDVRLMLSVPESPEFDRPGSILYFRVPDITEAHAELEARGVGFRGPPHRVARLSDHDLWLAFFEDGEGNTMALLSEVPHARGGA